MAMVGIYVPASQTDGWHPAAMITGDTATPEKWSSLAASDSVLVGRPNLWQETRRLEAGQRDCIDLVFTRPET